MSGIQDIMYHVKCWCHCFLNFCSCSTVQHASVNLNISYLFYSSANSGKKEYAQNQTMELHYGFI